jgi:hypothetical protein
LGDDPEDPEFRSECLCQSRIIDAVEQRTVYDTIDEFLAALDD